MLKDAQGLVLTTASPEAVAGFDDTMNGYLKYRADASLRLKAALQADPDCGMLHVLKGSFAMLAYKSSFVPAAKEAVAVAERLTARATPRERAHVAALVAWADGEMDRALSICTTPPRDSGSSLRCPAGRNAPDGGSWRCSG